MKYSKVAGAVRWSGGTVLLERGMSADDDHPLVVERPDLFTDDPPGARLARPAPPMVERATREPGETRPARASRAPAKPKKTSAAKAVEQGTGDGGGEGGTDE